MNNNKWKNKRAIVIARQSDAKKGTSSVAAQQNYITKKLEEVGMKTVEIQLLEGVSAAAPARITEILERLFKRKQEKNDFDVIAWQVEDRATRGGGEFGMWLQHECKRQGVLAYFADSDVDDQPYAAVVRTAKFEAAKESSVSNARRTTQGQDHAIKMGFFRTAGQTPMGCDRLYYDKNDNPKYIIRNVGNGLQEQVDFTTKTVISTFGTVGKRSRHRFIKQRNQYSLLYPGDRKQRRIVRVIFYLRYKKGWRGCRIADYLNRLQMPAPKGGKWSPRQVESVYENECYTGVTFSGRTYSGRFFCRDRDMGFKPVDRDACELAMRKTFTPKLRPQEDWDRIDQPHMYNFLPSDVRDLAIKAQTELWMRRLDPACRRKPCTGRPASEYIFSHKLTAKQDGVALVGTLSGDNIQYYRHPKGRQGRRKGSVFNKLIPAKPLHEEAVRLLADLLLTHEDELRHRLTKFVEEQRKISQIDAPGVAELEAERDDLIQTINSTVRALKGPALADVHGLLSSLGARRNEIEAQLARLKGPQQMDERTTGEVVDDAMKVLAKAGVNLLKLAPEPLRQALNHLIPNLTVDMETKTVEMTIALPTWATSAELGRANLSKTTGKAMCLTTSLQSQAYWWTQSIPMATYYCEYHHVRGSRVTSPCYRCQRKAA